MRLLIKKNSGFTLVELLVVIIIISLLAALLLPALGRATYAARTTVCLMQLKQLAIINSLYADDFGMVYPVVGSSYAYNLKWRWTVGYLDDPRLMHCPLDTKYPVSPKCGWFLHPTTKVWMHGNGSVWDERKIGYNFRGTYVKGSAYNDRRVLPNGSKMSSLSGIAMSACSTYNVNSKTVGPYGAAHWDRAILEEDAPHRDGFTVGYFDGGARKNKYDFGLGSHVRNHNNAQRWSLWDRDQKALCVFLPGGSSHSSSPACKYYVNENGSGLGWGKLFP